MVPESIRRAGPFEGNGVTTSFPFEFKTNAKEDLRIVKLALDVETDLTLDSDYSVTLNPDQEVDPGGSITYPISGSPLAADEFITIISNLSIEQQADLPNLGAFYPEVIEAALDRAVMLIGQLQEAIDRAIVLQPSTSGVAVDLPTPSAGAAIGWNATGDALANILSLGSLTVTGFGNALINAADAAACRTILGATAIGSTLFTAATAASARSAVSAAASGVNTDITSLSAPALGGATATTQAVGDASTKVATTAFASSAISAAVSALTPRTRQCVYSGPVDANGFSAFGGATGGTTVTAAGTLYASGAIGNLDYGSGIVNPSWTGLSTNGTMFLYFDIASNGTISCGSTTLAPIYQWGGAYSTANGQHTFNIQEMTMKVGNGATANATNPRVFVGEVTVSGGVVTAIIWYALMGRYDSGWTASLPGTGVQVSKNSNLGVIPEVAALVIECTTADIGYSVGDRVLNVGLNGVPATNSAAVLPLTANRNTVGFSVNNVGFYYTFNKTSGAIANFTAASWKYKLTASRGW